MQKYKLLLIDDDRVIIENLSNLFKFSDFEVYTAFDGSEGIQYALEIKPDIIICDVIMKQVNGYEVLKYIRSSVELFATPFIFITGISENESLRLGMELGADDYITKPFDNQVLLNAVNSRLNKHLLFKNHYEKRIDNIKKTLISTVPHEFRTPMNTILGFSQFLRENCKEVSHEDAYRMLDMIHRSGRRLLTQLVNMNMYYSFHTEFDFESYKDDITDNPIQKIEEIAKDYSHLYNKTYNLKINTDEAKIKFYDDYFIKVITEVIDNAYKFSSKNEILIDIASNSDFLVIKVKNFGRPLTNDEIQTIGAFTQFDRDIHEQQGSGLGFTIAKTLTLLYGGNIKIESDGLSYTEVTIDIVKA